MTLQQSSLPQKLIALLQERLSTEDIHTIADDYGERCDTDHKHSYRSEKSLYEQIIDKAEASHAAHLLVLQAAARSDLMGLLRVIYEYQPHLQEPIDALGFKLSSLIQAYLDQQSKSIVSLKKTSDEVPSSQSLVKEPDTSWIEISLETFLSNHSRITLAGRTSSESSTAMAHLTLRLSTAWHTYPTGPFPLFANLRHWFNPQMGLLQFLQEQIKWAGIPQLAEQLPALMNTGSFVLLLDGLHEMPYLRYNKTTGSSDDVRIRALVDWSQARDWHKLKCILGCQTKDFLTSSNWSEAFVLDSDLKKVLVSDSSIEQLILALSDEDANVRGDAINALNPLGDKRTTEPLINILQNDSNQAIRLRAAFALGNIDDECRIEPLLEALRDDDLRYTIATILGKIRDERLIEPLVALLADYHTGANMLAERALLTYGKAAVPALMVALTSQNIGWHYTKNDMHSSSDASYNAAEILGEIGDLRPLPLLMWLVKNDPIVREAHNGSKVRHVAEKAVTKILERHQTAAPLAAALHSTDHSTKTAAAFALGMRDDHRAVEQLVADLQDKEAPVRCGAAELLGRIGDPRAVVPLITAMADSEHVVSIAASDALRTFGELAVPALISALNHENSNVRAIAAMTLGKLRSKQAVDPLIATLTDKEVYVRGKAASALGMIRDRRALEPLLALAHDSQKTIRQELPAHVYAIDPESAIEVLIAALKDEDQDVRHWAARDLCRVENNRSVDALIEALNDEHHLVREYAGYALSNQKDSRAVEPLIANLQDEYSLAARSAATALGEIADSRAIEPLVARLSDENQDTCKRMAEALEKFGERAVPALLIALKDEGPDESFYIRTWDFQELQGDAALRHTLLSRAHLRYYAAQTLGVIGDLRALPILMWMAANDQNMTVYGRDKVQDAAAQSLNSIKQKHHDTDQLAFLLSDQDSSRRIGAAFALGMVDDKRAINILITALTHEDRRVRWGCAELLGNIGGNQAITALIANFRDATDEDILNTFSALNRIGISAIEPLINACKKENNASYSELTCISFALSQIGETVLQPLLKALQDQDHGVRNCAAMTLGFLRNQQAVEPLKALLEDRHTDTRLFAATSLILLGTGQMIAPIIAALNDSDEQLRSLAIEILLGTGNKQHTIDLCITALKDENRDMRLWAVEVLSDIGDSSAIPVLEKLAGVSSSPNRSRQNYQMQNWSRGEPYEKLTAGTKDQHQLHAALPQRRSKITVKLDDLVDSDTPDTPLNAAFPKSRSKITIKLDDFVNSDIPDTLLTKDTVTSEKTQIDDELRDTAKRAIERIKGRKVETTGEL